MTFNRECLSIFGSYLESEAEKTMSDHMSLHDNSTNSVELPFVVADTDGAMVYIIIVILWYSMGIVFLLGMDILPRSVENEDLERRRERSMIRNSRNRTNTKEILGTNNLTFILR